MLAWGRRNGRVHAQLKDICAILSGLMVAQDYRRGQQLLVDRNFSDNAQFFQVLPARACFATFSSCSLVTLSWSRMDWVATLSSSSQVV